MSVVISWYRIIVNHKKSSGTWIRKCVFRQRKGVIFVYIVVVLCSVQCNNNLLFVSVVRVGLFICGYISCRNVDVKVGICCVTAARNAMFKKLS